MDESTTPPAVEVRGLRSGYGNVEVLRSVDFTVGCEIFAVLGANGAGKSTLLATLARLLPVLGGSIAFHGNDATTLRAHDSARLGIGYVPQESAVFPDLTVIENLLIGGMIGRRAHADRLDEVFQTFPDLRSKVHLRAGNLSGGESRMVACGRALMQEPSILLLDEPTAGLSPLYVEMFFDAIVEIHRTRGMSIVVTEQNAAQALRVADRVMVLSVGAASAPMDANAVTTDLLKEGYRL